MSWESWERAWRAHSTTIAFRRRVQTAIQLAQSAASKPGKLFCSLSGGKDSAAMAGILDEAGLTGHVPAIYAHSALNFDDTLSAVEAIADRLNLELHVIEPTSIEQQIDDACALYRTTKPQGGVNGFNEFDLLEALPKDRDVLDCLKFVHRACAAGNMLVAYTYEHDFAGSFVGLRADESKGRAAHARFHGYDHASAIDGKRTVCPLLGWTGQDVFAYLIVRGIPIHPYYRKAYETGLLGDADPATLRVDMTLMPPYPAAHGALAILARVYPETFRKLAGIRPELRRYI